MSITFGFFLSSFHLWFQDFLLANNVVASRSEIPTRNMLSPIHLNRIFDVYTSKIKEVLKTAPPQFSMTSDIWTDKYRHRSFICFTVHFVDSNFRLLKYSLKTEPFDGSHTGEAIAQKISAVANEFNFSLSSVIIVSQIRMKSSDDYHWFVSLRSCYRYLTKVQTCVKHGGS